MCQFNIFHFCFWNRQLSIVLFLKTPSRSVTIFRPSPCYIPHSTPDSLLLKGKGASKYTEELLQQTLLALLWSGAGPSPVNSSPPFNNMTNVQWKSNTVLYPISGGFILSRFDCSSIGYSCSDNQICSVKKLVLIWGTPFSHQLPPWSLYSPWLIVRLHLKILNCKKTPRSLAPSNLVRFSIPLAIGGEVTWLHQS